MIQVECSKCGDLMEATGVVTLPFICAACEATEDKFAHEGIECDCTTRTLGCGGDCIEGCNEQAGDPEPVSCDTASVENTTRLIAGLEEEIAELKEENDDLRVSNGDLLRENLTTQDRLDYNIIRNSELLEENEKLRNELSTDFIAEVLGKVIITLKEKIDSLQLEISDLEMKLASEKQTALTYHEALDWANGRRDYWMSSCWKANEAFYAEKTKSWARKLWETLCDDLTKDTEYGR